MNSNTLVISELFSSIQGEGPTAGRPAVFLRLAGCNLRCESSQWSCDSVKLWTAGKMKTNELIAATVMKHLIPIPISQRRMVITGGEPLLQQKAIVSLLSILSKELILEIETNGTIIPNTFLQSRVDQFNCSPKLRSSGMLFNKRLNPKAIQVFKDVGSIFKFVVSDDKDIEEMECMIESCHIDLSKVWLMPAAASRKQLIEKSEYIWRYCSAKGYNFSPRLQVLAFDLKTGI